MPTSWRYDPEPARARDVKVAGVVALRTGHVEEDLAMRQATISGHLVAHHHFLVLVPVANVEVLLVG
jgi:hypothetical protein